MHEMSIAASVLDAVRTEARRRGGARVTKVGLKIGELAGIDPEALRFCFEALTQDSDLAPLAFDLQFCPRANRCKGCERVFAAEDYNFHCPGCGSADTELAAGNELEFSYLEIEEP